MKHRTQNSAYRIQPSGAWNHCWEDELATDGARPSRAWRRKLEKGADAVGAARASLVASRLCPFETRAKAGGRVGATGLMRAKSDEKCRIRPLKRVAARLGPPSPTFAHIDFFREMNNDGIQMRPTPCPLPRAGTRGRGSDYGAMLPRVAPKRHGATTGLNDATLRLVRFAVLCAEGAKLCEKFFGFYRVVWLPKPATRWVPSRVVLLRETWSGFIGYYRTRKARIIAFSRFLSIRAFFQAKLGTKVEKASGRRNAFNRKPTESCGVIFSYSGPQMFFTCATPRLTSSGVSAGPNSNTLMCPGLTMGLSAAKSTVPVPGSQWSRPGNCTS